jgi:hypothetical protein
MANRRDGRMGSRRHRSGRAGLRRIRCGRNRRIRFHRRPEARSTTGRSSGTAAPASSSPGRVPTRVTRSAGVAGRLSSMTRSSRDVCSSTWATSRASGLSPWRRPTGWTGCCERVPVLRVPGDRPAARRSRAGGYSVAVDASEDRGHQLRERVPLADRTRGRPTAPVPSRRAPSSRQMATLDAAAHGRSVTARSP